MNHEFFVTHQSDRYKISLDKSYIGIFIDILEV